MPTFRKKKKIGPIEVPDTTPLTHGVEDAANRLSAAVETAAARTTKTAKKTTKTAKKSAKQARDRANHAQSDLKRARRKRRFLQFTRRRLDSDAILKAQLAKTSHELSRESTDLNQAVGSLNSVIKANRRAAARGRTRLIGGIVIGAVLTYHLDSEHGKERRQASARRVRGVVGGRSS